MKRWLLALAAVLAVAGCGSSTTSGLHTVAPSVSSSPAPQPSASPTGTWGPTSCGFERWPVKTGTDPMAGQVNLADVVPTTVQQLGQITAPDPSALPQDSRLGPTETTVYQVHATLVGYKMESDSDYHLILNQMVTTSAGTRTYSMIAEIPDPSCIQGYPALSASPFLAGIEQARTAFDARFRTSDVFQSTDISCTIVGVGFFDRIHGQQGVAPNGIELHPVLSIQFAG